MSTAASRVDSARQGGEPVTHVKVWDLPLRLFHWTLVLAVAVAFLSSDADSAFNQWHMLAGWLAGILIVARLAWGFVGGEHSRFTDFVRPSRLGEHIKGVVERRAEPTLGHNPLGGLSVVVLLLLVAATVWTGAFGGEGTEDAHELIAWTLLGFIGVHIAAVLLMSLLQRENLVGAMITGRKSVLHHPGAANARGPGVFGILVIAAVLAATVYGILNYDPRAFTPRRAESPEQPGTSEARVPPSGEVD